MNKLTPEKAAQLLLSELQKAKKMPIGTVNPKTGRKKVAEGKWVPVNEGKDKKTEPEKPKEKKPEPKKEEKKFAISDESKSVIKNTLKRMASVLADALSLRDLATSGSGATEQTGEDIKARMKKKPAEPAKKDTDK